MGAGIESLVNQQVLKWHAEARAADTSSTQPEICVQRPMITIARECGAMGTQIGRIVARRLGFDFFDRELVEEVARSAKVQKVLVELVDDRVQDVISTWIAEQFGGDTLSPTDYLTNLSRVVLSLGSLGHAVIVGRGAHFILDPNWTLRVRALAPLEIRAQRMALSMNITEAAATEYVASKDKERRIFARRHFGKNITDPSFYDLIINTGILPLDTCAEMIYLAFRARFGSG